MWWGLRSSCSQHRGQTSDPPGGALPPAVRGPLPALATGPRPMGTWAVPHKQAAPWALYGKGQDLQADPRERGKRIQLVSGHMPGSAWGEWGGGAVCAPQTHRPLSSLTPQTSLLSPVLPPLGVHRALLLPPVLPEPPAPFLCHSSQLNTSVWSPGGPRPPLLDCAFLYCPLSPVLHTAGTQAKPVWLENVNAETGPQDGQ